MYGTRNHDIMTPLILEHGWIHGSFRHSRRMSIFVLRRTYTFRNSKYYLHIWHDVDIHNLKHVYAICAVILDDNRSS